MESDDRSSYPPMGLGSCIWGALFVLQNACGAALGVWHSVEPCAKGRFGRAQKSGTGSGTVVHGTETASIQRPDSSCPARQYFNYLTAEYPSAVLLLGEIWMPLSLLRTFNTGRRQDHLRRGNCRAVSNERG
jgi:hypothetical protein